jgi:signal transduction histidine kinase
MTAPMRLLTFSGFLTWLIVGVPSFAWAWELGPERFTAWAVAFAGFIVLYALTQRPGCSSGVELVLAAGEAIAALTIVALLPNGFSGILLVIVAAQVGSRGLPVALPWIAAQTIVFGLLQAGEKPRMVVEISAAYFAFQLFAALTARIAHSEADARLALAEANAELKVTSGLLAINSRNDERLRIARDLHDLIGHHLTALSLNLEVANHLAAQSGDARTGEHIAKSQAIAKRLLSDVRDVVSRTRDAQPLGLGEALMSLRDVIVKPALELEIDGALEVRDAEVAQAALRAVQEIVTNAVRHSAARTLWLRVASNGNGLEIDAKDDGVGTDDVRFGNGLRGMRERLGAVHGTIEVSSSRGRGFEVRIRMPLEASA